MVVIILGILLALQLALWATAWFRGGIGPGSAWHRWVERNMVLVMLVLLPAHWLYSEHWYRNHISPGGITDVANHYARFGEPQRIRVLQRDGANYYHLHGHLPPAYILALPSESAVYVFDSRGQFLSWCPDTGDGEGEAHWREWPRDAGVDISSPELKTRLARETASAAEPRRSVAGYSSHCKPGLVTLYETSPTFESAPARLPAFTNQLTAALIKPISKIGAPT